MPEPFDVLEEVIAPRLEAPVAGALAPTPYNFEFTGEDALRLTVHNSQSGVVVAVHYRMKDRRQQLVANRFTLTPTNDRLATTSEFPIGEGYLLNVTVFAASGSPVRGQTFVRLQVIRGRAGAAVVLGTIVQGYVTGSQDRAWPGSPIEGALDGDGYTRYVAGSDPAAGENVSETVPTGARWQLHAMGCLFTTDVNVANRRVALQVYNGATRRFASEIPTNLVAGTDYVLTFGEGLTPTTATPSLSANGVLSTTMRLLAGEELRTNNFAGQPGDNFAAPQMLVTEWLEAA